MVTGVTWAATGAGPSSQTFPEGNAPQIIVTPLTVEVSGSFEVLGTGFKHGSFVLFELVGGAGVGNLLLGSGQANDRGAFIAGTGNLTGGVLPDTMGPGVYSIVASSIPGEISSYPLVVVEEK